MELKPIEVTLSTFEKMEILRLEMKKRVDEYNDICVSLLDLSRDFERAKFLNTICPHFSPEPPDAAQKKQQNAELKDRRVKVHEMVDALRNNLRALAAEAGITIEEDASIEAIAAQLEDKTEDLKKFFKKK